MEAILEILNMETAKTNTSRSENIFSGILGILVLFAVLAHGAHDLWVATLIYVTAAALAVALILKRCWPVTGPGVSWPMVIPTLLLVGTFGLSYLFSVNPSESFMGLMDWVSALLLLFVSFHVLKKDEPRNIFLGFVFIAVLAEFVMQVFLRIKISGWLINSETFGSLMNANVSAAFHLFFLPVFAERFFDHSQSSVVKKIGLGGAVLCLANILFSGSVSAYSVLLVAILVLLKPIWASGSENKRRLIISAMSLAGVLILFLNWQKLAQLFGWPGALFPTRTTGRWWWWKTGLLMWQAHPWSGVGIGNFSSAMLAFKGFSGDNTRFAHSFVVTLLSETGALGFGAVALFLFTWFSGLHKNSLMKMEKGIVIGVISFFIYTLVNIGIEVLVNLMVLGIFLGWAYEPRSWRLWKPKRIFCLIPVAAWIAALPSLVNPFLASQNVVYAEGLLNQNLSDEKTAEEHLANAVRSFSEALRLDSKSASAERGLARALVLQAQGRQDPQLLYEGIEHQKKALQLNRYAGLLYWELGHYYQLGGNKNEAVQAFRRGVELHSNNRVFQEDLAKALEEVQ